MPDWQSYLTTQELRANWSIPAMDGFVVTPDDVSVFDAPIRGLMVTGAGDVRVKFARSGNIVTLPQLQPGQVYGIFAIKVLATGTTATGIIALR